MPTLVIPDIPDDVYERLQERATRQHLSLEAETLILVTRALQQDPQPAPRLPDYVPGEEISAPFDLPRSSKPVKVKARTGKLRLPDPVLIIRE